MFLLPSASVLCLVVSQLIQEPSGKEESVPGPLNPTLRQGRYDSELSLPRTLLKCFFGLVGKPSISTPPPHHTHTFILKVLMSHSVDISHVNEAAAWAGPAPKVLPKEKKSWLFLRFLPHTSSPAQGWVGAFDLDRDPLPGPFKSHN